MPKIEILRKEIRIPRRFEPKPELIFDSGLAKLIPASDVATRHRERQRAAKFKPGPEECFFWPINELYSPDSVYRASVNQFSIWPDGDRVRAELDMISGPEVFRFVREFFVRQIRVSTMVRPGADQIITGEVFILDASGTAIAYADFFVRSVWDFEYLGDVGIKRVGA